MLIKLIVGSILNRVTMNLILIDLILYRKSCRVISRQTPKNCLLVLLVGRHFTPCAYVVKYLMPKRLS